jgi:TolA-binding protein
MKPTSIIWKLEDQKASMLIDRLFDQIERLEREVEDLKRPKQILQLTVHKHGVFDQYIRAQSV